MTIGAGSIKRAAKTANAGTKAATVTGVEDEVMEAVAGDQEKSVELAEEEAAVPESTTAYEAYGIGQQLPVYLL